MQQLGLDLGLLVSQLVNFALIVGLLYLLLYKPILSRLDERASRIRKGLEDAEQAEQVRTEAQRHYQEEIEHARREAREIVEQATRAAEQQRQEILARAREEAHALVLRAQQQAQREIQEGQIALRQEVVNLSIAAAGRLLQREIDDEQHHALVQEFIRETEQLR